MQGQVGTGHNPGWGFCTGQAMLLGVASLWGVLVGCPSQGVYNHPLVGLSQSPVTIEPTSHAVGALEKAGRDYDHDNAMQGEVEDLTLVECIALAVRNNRGLQQATYGAQQQGLEQIVARRELDQPFLRAGYSVHEGDDNAEGRIATVGRLAGFEIEPYLSFDFEEDDSVGHHTTNYGIAISRQIFRIDYEHVNQMLPLTRATRDFHIAINDRLLELRNLRLSVVRNFYNIQRLKKRVRVRSFRVDDARQFLKQIEEKVKAGFTAEVEKTNALINLNQAQTDLVREQTNLQNTKEEFLDLLGLPLGFQITVSDEDLEAIRSLEFELDKDLHLINKSHETVLNKALEMVVQRQQLQVSKAELIPDMKATFTSNRRGEGGDGDVMVDLQLNVPLDGYRAERAQAAKDRLELMVLAVELAAIRSDLQRQLRRQYRVIVQFKHIVSLAGQRLESERQKLAARMQIYEKQGGDNLEVTRAKEAVDDAEVDLLDARIDLILEEAAYVALLPSKD